MTLQELYDKEGLDGLKRLGAKVSADPKYLWQCATKRRKPSFKLARQIAGADRRFSLEELRGDIFGAAA